MEDKFTSKEILDYITEQSNANISLTRKLSLYTKATEKNLEVDQHSLILWLNYIDILKTCDNDNDEIRGMYKMLQAKFGRFLEFWIAYLEFERKICSANVKKIIEKNKKWLEMKEYEERNAILVYFKNIIKDIDGCENATQEITNSLAKCEKETEQKWKQIDGKFIYENEHASNDTKTKNKTIKDNVDKDDVYKDDIERDAQIYNIENELYIENKSNMASRRYSAKFTSQENYINKQHTTYKNVEKCAVNNEQENIQEIINQKQSFSSVFVNSQSKFSVKNNTNNSIYAGIDNLQINKYEQRGKKSILPSILQSNGVSKFYSPLSSVKRLPKNRNNLHFDDNQILNGFYELKNDMKKETTDENSENNDNNKDLQYNNDVIDKLALVNNKDNINDNINNTYHDSILNRKTENIKDKIAANKENNYNENIKDKIAANKENNYNENTKNKNTFATNLSNIKFKTVDINKQAKNNYKFDFDTIDCKKDVTNQINKIFARDVPKQLQTNICNELMLKDKKLQIIREIGKGGSCIVYQVLHENNVYALKKVNIGNENETVMQGYLDEIKFLNKLKGKNEIITLVDYEQKNGYLNVLMEYGETDLANLIRKDKTNLKSINYVRSLWERMLLAVKTIHDARIVHRDLKPANFLLVKGKLKLIDFGISKAIRNDTTNINFESHVGTINYMAPEAVDSEKSKMGRSSDIWSLGCILYEIIYGYPPLHHCTNFAKKIMILQDKKHEIEYPETADDFFVAIQSVKKCLKRQANERSTIEELLNDDFLNLKDKLMLRKKDLIDFTKAVWKINGNEKINIKMHAEKVVDEFLKKLDEKRNKK